MMLRRRNNNYMVTLRITASKALPLDDSHAELMREPKVFG